MPGPSKIEVTRQDIIHVQEVYKNSSGQGLFSAHVLKAKKDICPVLLKLWTKFKTQKRQEKFQINP